MSGSEQILRVAVLTRTGRSSGMALASAIQESRHTLVGIVAEKRTSMLRKIINRNSLRELIKNYGFNFIFMRAIDVLFRRNNKNETAVPENIKSKISVLDSLNSEKASKLLSSLKPDLILIANAPIIKEGIFRIAPYGALNFHSGHLPEYGGLASEFWAMFNDDTEAWATIHKVEARLDSGSIMAEEPVAISAKDTPDTLHAKLISKAAEMIPPLLDSLADGSANPVRHPGNSVLMPWPGPAEQRILKKRQK